MSASLTPKQVQAVGHLLTEPSIAAAATKTGINERTIRRWLDDPAFSAAYREARRDAVQLAIGRLQQVSGAAVGVLVRLMADTASPAGTRLQAAKTVLEFSLRAVELEDIEARLKALEEAGATR